jgi:alginate O-acetyltransferase complex protein AlgI
LPRGRTNPRRALHSRSVLFTSVEYLILLATVFVLYWTIRVRTVQNALLLATSYVFYGWVHPWFCILIAASTVADYFFARAIRAQPSRARLWLGASLVFNLGLLGFYKYFDFFAANVHAALTEVGIPSDPVVLGVLLPVGISFYTFQTLSYTIDVYRGELEPRRSFLDFALFVSFFPQLVAGPIERARNFLPQVERARRFRWDLFASAWPLLVSGYFKKMVVADNVASSSDLVFALESPSFTVLLAGTIAFAAQIACDFSGYTDIARGSARLLGFELIRNFNLPYLAISPSDFWRRWHISFSSWIRDYLYIPLGGSKAGGKLRLLLVLLASMGLSGLWHGAAWNFVLWGVFHAVVLFLYHAHGLRGGVARDDDGHARRLGDLPHGERGLAVERGRAWRRGARRRLARCARDDLSDGRVLRASAHARRAAAAARQGPPRRMDQLGARRALWPASRGNPRLRPHRHPRLHLLPVLTHDRP